MLKALITEIKIKSSAGILLSNINLELEGGKIYTILGKNGSGKSTLIKSLTRLLDERFYSLNGKVEFENEDLWKISEDELNIIRREKIKYVFQDAVNSFDPLKKLEYYFNLLIKDKPEIDKALDEFILPGKNELFKCYPYEISGGMAQRAAFLLSILQKPRLLILDEPTSGIDTGIANIFIHKMKEFVSENNRAILMVTQDLLFAERVSDKTALLKNGNLSLFTEKINEIAF